MSTYTPTEAEVIQAWVEARESDRPGEDAPEATAEIKRFLATVRPNPADARQVETVAQAIYEAVYPSGQFTWDVAAGAAKRYWSATARAVLAALAEAVGRGN